jgi:SAM-dependent methyltransferase
MAEKLQEKSVSSPKVFDHYARYYDLLYKDKDYLSESKYVASLIRQFTPQAKSLLEIGCGTGEHARHMSKQGFAVTGIDLSLEMLERARQKNKETDTFNFIQGDFRTLNLGRKYDAVVSLFHVLSYQTQDEDLKAAIRTAALHLNPGGVFICDFWYGPAVLAQKPELRVKRLEDDQISVTRIAEPVLDVKAHTVDVKYDVFIQEKVSRQILNVKETHKMRYLDKPELEDLLRGEGMAMRHFKEFLTDQEPSETTWGICLTAQWR